VAVRLVNERGVRAAQATRDLDVHEKMLRKWVCELAADRTYGARRVWHDVLALGQYCGLHPIGRLIMRLQPLRARRRRLWLPAERGERGVLANNLLDRQFQELLSEQGITRSMRRADEDWDISAMESLFNSLKIERTARKVFRTREQARAEVFDHIERFYNPASRHSTLGHISPIASEKTREAQVGVRRTRNNPPQRTLTMAHS